MFFLKFLNLKSNCKIFFSFNSFFVLDISLNEKLFFNINKNKSTFKRDNRSLKKVVFVGLLDSNFIMCSKIEMFMDLKQLN